ncbi:hypothetical protein HHK36_015304 [Tetracentron sinense]|uniref:Protein kinase domain-containing protein n=1 Tax=Tetracentron sinense TaxID=13715 RepID=A0A835DGN2_TETSI|nr:hypothetical protein HHK36_015304 [Tetracentron sinense]
MGNCLDASARVDNGQSFQTTSVRGLCFDGYWLFSLFTMGVFLVAVGLGASKSSSKASPSTPSSWAVPSYCNKTTAESLPTPRSEGEILSSPNLKAFSFSKLKNATRNFHPSSLIKQGGFGYVFKGWIDEKTLAAVRPGSGMIITVKKLKSEERAEALSWAIRIKVAIGAARGLSFLHDAESQVIHHDFAAYSILLDAEFNAKLSNFGLAKADPTVVTFKLQCSASFLSGN